jgi:hypothetical protein
MTKRPRKTPREKQVYKFSREKGISHKIENVVELLMKLKDPDDLIKLPAKLRRQLKVEAEEFVELGNHPEFDVCLAKHTILIFKSALPQMFRSLREKSLQEGLLGLQAKKLVFDLLRLLDTKKEDDEAFDRISDDEIEFEMRDIERRLLDEGALRKEVKDVSFDEIGSSSSHQAIPEAQTPDEETDPGAGPS